MQKIKSLVRVARSLCLLGKVKSATPNFSRYPFLCDSMRTILRDKRTGGRHAYVWGVLSAADLAQHLGISQISVIEFGVASGKGLMALEGIARLCEQKIGIKIDVFGFDTGVGLPKPKDYRDLPNLWQEGYFPMDRDVLTKKLEKAHLILGDVSETVKTFVQSKPAPVGFVAFDLDLYSSTSQALELFRSPGYSHVLPRVHCYFDDIWGWTYSDFTGELLAISEFNTTHKDAKLSKIYGLRHLIDEHGSYWPEQIYLAHFFSHPQYCEKDNLLQTSLL